MRKKIIAFLAATLVLLAGCGSGGDSASVSIDPETAAQAILDQVEFQDTLVKLEDSAVESRYRMDDSIVAYAIYVSGTSSTAEEIAVLQTTDEASRGSARTAVDKRIDDQKFQYENYVPKEMVKLGDPVIVEKGNTVIMVLADDSAAAKAVVDSLFQ